jgi:hypothetical protein
MKLETPLENISSQKTDTEGGLRLFLFVCHGLRISSLLWLTLLFSDHRIALLMQCVELIAGVP